MSEFDPDLPFVGDLKVNRRKHRHAEGSAAGSSTTAGSRSKKSANNVEAGANVEDVFDDTIQIKSRSKASVSKTRSTRPPRPTDELQDVIVRGNLIINITKIPAEVQTDRRLFKRVAVETTADDNAENATENVANEAADAKLNFAEDGAEADKEVKGERRRRKASSSAEGGEERKHRTHKKVTDAAKLDELGLEVVEIPRKKRRNLEGLFGDENKKNDMLDVTADAPIEAQLKYESMLNHIYSLLSDHFKNIPETTKFTTPIVGQAGSKMTCIANLKEIAMQLHREEDHLREFIEAELGTTGTFAEDKLNLRGNYTLRSINDCIARYRQIYVICNGCKGAKTIFTKEERHYMVKCELCGATRTVQQIKGTNIKQ